MAAFYFDHDVSAFTASYLRVLGHDVVTTPQRHKQTASDEEQLLQAVDLERILVTHNGPDFVLLHRLWLRLAERWGSSEQHQGILIIPQRAAGLWQWQPRLAAEQISEFAADHPSLRGTL